MTVKEITIIPKGCWVVLLLSFSLLLLASRLLQSSTNLVTVRVVQMFSWVVLQSSLYTLLALL